jgi:hypothetical protein
LLCFAPQRYWSVQRSAMEIIDNMHRLLELEKDGIPGNNPPGLVAWWTFEDGGGKQAAADVTGHRFKTPIVRRQNDAPHTVGPAVADAAAVDGRQSREAGPGQQRAASPAALSRTAGAVAGPNLGYFTKEEKARYRIPQGAAKLLPAPYRKLLPGDEVYGPPAEIHEQGDVARGEAGHREERTGAPDSRVAPPWGSWMRQLPRWNWLSAETLPTPQLPAAVRAALEKAGGAPQPPGATSQPPVPPHVGKKGAIPGTGHPSGGQSALPVPSLRAKGICPYELRRHRLATKGRELQREVECPLGRNSYVAMLPLSSVVHRRKCTGCPEKVKAVDVRFHVRFGCRRRIVPCRFDYCQASFAVEYREEHERTDCQHMYARNKVLSLVGS